MADRSDYLPAARLQDLAQTIDPKLQLEPDATQVGDPFRSCRRRWSEVTQQWDRSEVSDE